MASGGSMDVHDSSAGADSWDPTSVGRVRRGRSSRQHSGSAVHGQPQVHGRPGSSGGVVDAYDLSGAVRSQGGEGASGLGLMPAPQMRRKPQNNKLINRQVAMAADRGNLARLLDIIQVHLHDMNGLNLSTAFHRVAKLSSSEGDPVAKMNLVKSNPIFKQLLQEVWEHIIYHSLSDGPVLSMAAGGEDQASPEGVLERSPASFTRDAAQQAGWEMPVACMSIVTWSCATMRIRDSSLFGTIASIITPRLDALQSFELSNLLWAYAKISLVPSELFDAAGEQLAVTSRNKFKGQGQCLCTIAWSFTTAERRDSKVFAALAEEMKAVATNLKTQEISNALWAFAKSSAVDAELFDLLGNTAVREPNIWMFKPQELSNSVWAFATVALHHPKFFEMVAKAAVIKRHDMVPQNIANILWSFAKLQVPSFDVFLSLLEVALGRLALYKRHELSSVIWAAAQVCPQYAEFFGGASMLCYERLNQFSATALANLTRDLSGVDTDVPLVFIDILREGARRLPLFDVNALCVMLRGGLTAFTNPALQHNLEDVAELLNLIAAQLMPHVHHLRTVELQDVSAALEDCSVLVDCHAGVALRTCPPALSILEQALCGELSARKKGATIRSPQDDEDGGFAACAHALPAFQCDEATEKPRPSELPPVPNFSSLATAPTHSGGLSESAEFVGSLVRVGFAAGSAPAAIASGPSSKSGGLREEQLQCFSVSCLTEQGPGGILRPFDLSAYSGWKVIGVGDHIVSLRHGVCDVRVVLKRAPTSFVPTIDQDHPNFLQPFAMITTGTSPSTACGAEPAPGPSSQNCIAYAHCRHGSLVDWMKSRQQGGRPVSVSEAAHIAKQMLLLVEALLPICSEVVGVLQPDEIFIDEEERPRLRRPLPGNPAGWDDKLKWMSPSEVSGDARSKNDLWPAVCFRIGMLLYFMNTGIPTDPYPQKTGETVLMDFLAEVGGNGPCIRPDMEAYGGPSLLKRLIAACFQTTGQEPPIQAALTSVLDVFSAKDPTSKGPVTEFAM